MSFIGGVLYRGVSFIGGVLYRGVLYREVSFTDSSTAMETDARTYV